MNLIEVIEKLRDGKTISLTLLLEKAGAMHANNLVGEIKKK